jgi:septal ring factor EnvC (AmiA/AmiB activator)
MTPATIVRRTVTVFLVCATVIAGFGAIRVAADWTASAAPLEASPIAAEELKARLADEQDRSGMLEDRLATLTGHAQQLEAALATAQARLDADTSNAQDLTAQLAAAKQKLAALERSIRQARAVQSTVVVTTTTRTGSGGGAPGGEVNDD